MELRMEGENITESIFDGLTYVRFKLRKELDWKEWHSVFHTNGNK